MASANKAEERTTLLAHEAILLDRWRKGDEDAFNTLIHENLTVAERLALKLTKDPNAAEDVVSETLVRAFRSAAKFHGDAQFKTWLHRIVVNCVLDLKRRKSFPLISLDELYAEEDGSCVHMQLAYDGPNALDLLLETEQFDAVRRSIDKLVEEQKNLVLLFHKNGLGYERIATQVHAPIGTVKSRLHRARQTIKDHIEREDHNTNKRSGYERLKAS